MFVDLDLKGSLSLPGTISSAAIQKCLDIEEEFGSTPITNNYEPITYYFGYNEPFENTLAYSLLLKTLGAAVKKKIEGNND